MTDTVSIETIRTVQRDLGLNHLHVMHVGVAGFTLAHTDEERAAVPELDTCDLHQWIVNQDGPPVEPGFYVVIPHRVDAYSESYPVPLWDFEPVELYTNRRLDDE